MSSAKHVIDWRKRTKTRIIEAFGGSCGCCGYNKCQDALELHHLDPTAKEFSFGGARATCVGWTRLVQELRKCVLVCSLCHREIHAKMREIPVSIHRFDEKFSDYQTVERQDRLAKMLDSCPICGKEKPKTQKTCSYVCAFRLKGSYLWENFDLNDMWINKKMSIKQICEVVGCSDNGARKRLRKLGIYSSRYC